MQNRITCFQLNWYNCGLCFAENIVQEEITIDRNDNTVSIKGINGTGVVCSCKTIQADTEKVEEFFNFLEAVYQAWKSDYNILVYDGSAWKMRLLHDANTIKEVQGTIQYPPCGKAIEEHILSLMPSGGESLHPRMFGCSR